MRENIQVAETFTFTLEEHEHDHEHEHAGGHDHGHSHDHGGEEALEDPLENVPVLKDVARLDNCVTVIDACNFESTFRRGSTQTTGLSFSRFLVFSPFLGLTRPRTFKDRCPWRRLFKTYFFKFIF